jgi:hypothetical protein
MRPLITLALAVPLLALAAVPQESKLELDTRPRKLDCTHLDWMKQGRPVFVDSGDGVRLGISTRNDIVSPGEPVVVDIWVDNQSDKAVWSGGRCPPYLHYGDVFDASGRRLVGIREQRRREAEKSGGTTVDVCQSTEMLVPVPPHTCKAPVDVHGNNYTLDYNLAPGVYYIFPVSRTDPRRFKEGLKITVRER